jgi:methionine-rich copper-binding protein CopC
MRTLLTLLSFLAVTAAQARDMLDHADPAFGSTLASAPHEVTLSFTQNLEPAFSSVIVTDGSGTRVDEGKPQVSGSTMSVALRAIGPGIYHVRWHALSVDTHKTEGNFTFYIGK